MTTNQVTGMNGLANILNGMFDRIGDQKGTTGVSGVKFAETAGVSDSLTVTYTDAKGVERNIDVPSIELPKGAVTGETLASVLRKLDDASSDIRISPESMKVLKDVAEAYLAKVKDKFLGTQRPGGEGDKSANPSNLKGPKPPDPKPPTDGGGRLPGPPVNSAPSVFSIIQEALYLLIECANEQAKTARQGKLASQLQEYAAILRQSDAQVKNAIAGMATAILSGALQLVVAWAMTGESKDAAKVKCDNGVTVAQSNLTNAKLTGNEPKALKAMNETAKTLEIPETTKNTVERSVTGDFKEVELEPLKPEDAGYSAGRAAKIEQGFKVAKAKADLETVANGGKVSVKGEGAEQHELTLEEAQDAFKAEVDKSVDLYKADADKARGEYMALRDNPGSTDVEIKAAHEKLKAAQNDYQYASAVRTKTLSQTVQGKDGSSVPVISRDGLGKVISERHGDLQEANMNMRSDPNYAKLSNEMPTEMKRDMYLQVCRALDSAVQSGLKLLDAEATRIGAEKVKAEQDADSWENSWQAARKLVESVLSFMEAQNASIRNANMA